MPKQSEREELLRVQDPLAASQWVEAEVRRWRYRATEHHQAYTDTALSDYHAFRHLPADAWFNRALAFGGGDGHEVLPILDRTKRVTIIDASGLPLHPALVGIGAETRQPLTDGSIAEADGAFDLITCFGVLTYLPDPIASFAELRRCLAPGGWLMLREPIVAMNLEQPEHAGLGRHGRGIPLPEFDDLVRQGFTVCSRSLCTVALTKHFGPNPFNRPRVVRLDAALARFFAWNVHYRATRSWHRLRPKAAAYVLRRQ
jgi:SAM-dependent methyltransferase